MSVANQTLVTRVPALGGLFADHPVASAIGIWIIDAGCVAFFTLLAQNLVTGLDPVFVALVLVSILTALALTVLGWWRAVGYNGPSHWRELGLLIIPAAAIIIIPFVAGSKTTDLGTFGYLVFSYFLVGFHEETVYRGIVLKILRPSGPVRAIFLSALLFGLAHLGNVLVRNPFIAIAQAVGAFTGEGVGFGVLRIRTNTIWFFVILHALHDLFLQYTRLPSIPVDVVQDVILFLYGLYLIRNRRALFANPDEAAGRE